MVAILQYFLMAIMRLMVSIIMAGIDHQIGRSTHVCSVLGMLLISVANLTRWLFRHQTSRSIRIQGTRGG